MAQPIGGLNGVPNLIGPGRPVAMPAEPATGATSFQDLLFKSLQSVEQTDLQAQSAIETGLVGGDLSQAEVFTAMKKAELAFRTLVQVRNKVLSAYQEVQQMRM